MDLPRMRTGGMRAGIFAVFTPSAGAREEPLARADGVVEFEMAPRVDRDVAAAHATVVAGRLLGLERAGAVRVARTPDDLDTARDGGPPAAVLHLAGAEAIDPDLESLELWHAAGLRSIGLAWSRPNAFGHGVPFVAPSSPDTGPGLTDAGRGLVRRCEELGIMLDVSHLNEAGFWDVARFGKAPIVASHSAAHALCACSRNLTDDQLDAIGASGGLVGIVFACALLRPDFADDSDTPIGLIAEHTRYVADRIGVAHVGLGSDFDGATVPARLGDVAALPRLLAALSDAGFTDDEIASIAWNNWRRVTGACWHAEYPCDRE
jgi:membrane dipeptidase